MESKHKNALIGALLAVVFVMAVGYAAFAQQLTINGTAEISSSWDIHFDPAYIVSNDGAYSTEQGKNGSGQTVGTAPSGTITYGADNQQVTIDADLYQPGDKVKFTLKPTNYGIGLNGHGKMTITDGTTTSAHAPSFPTDNPSWAGTSVIEGTATNTESKVVLKKGYIQFTVTPSFANSLAPNNADTIEVVAEYLQPNQNATDLVQTSAGITIVLNYQQV